MPVVATPPVVVFVHPAPPAVPPRVTVTPNITKPYVAPQVIAPRAQTPIIVAPKPAYVPPPIYYAPRPVYPAPVYAPPTASQPAKVPFWKRLFTRKPKPQAMAAPPVYAAAQPQMGAPAYGEMPVEAGQPSAYASQPQQVIVRESGVGALTMAFFLVVLLLIGAGVFIIIRRKD